MFGLEQTIQENELRIAELEEESLARKNGAELDSKLAKEDKIRLTMQIDTLTDRQRMYRAELSLA